MYFPTGHTQARALSWNVDLAFYSFKGIDVRRQHLFESKRATLRRRVVRRGPPRWRSTNTHGLATFKLMLRCVLGTVRLNEANI